MATRFSQQFKSMGASVLMHTFGETITYVPGNGGKTRTIAARVIRGTPVVKDEIVYQGNVAVVYDDATNGIASASIDAARDRIRVQIIEGGPVETRGIGDILSRANGQVKFEIT